MPVFTIKKLFIAYFLIFISTFSFADVVKPALIEINVNKQGQIDVEIRASLEALLTGINGKYKNTKDAPNAAEYDVLRKMSDSDLQVQFDKFKTNFLDSIRLMDADGDKVVLTISKVKIPEPGYTKVPRISVINLKGSVDVSVQSLAWYYPMSFGDNAVRLRQVDKAKEKYHWSEWQWLRDDKPSEALSLTEVVARMPIYKTISNYIVYGFEHILPKGLDHILFILGLFLFSTKFKPLLWQVTMFTLAHTITLGLAMNGIISLPANIVEPLIALSIAYVGIENIFSKKLHSSRLILVFAFGLLHGLGFASVLADFGMPDDAFAVALISFNIGVELGQLAIILGAFLLVGYWFGKKPWYKQAITVPVSMTITLVALYWFVERLDIGFIS
ncbi:MAG: HupE/UreJ family protein [Cocleimonas sp.]|nr:HupE/UreJ family protein [Cocleimonas sp.]